MNNKTFNQQASHVPSFLHVTHTNQVLQVQKHLSKFSSSQQNVQPSELYTVLYMPLEELFFKQHFPPFQLGLQANPSQVYSKHNSAQSFTLIPVCPSNPFEVFTVFPSNFATQLGPLPTNDLVYSEQPAGGPALYPQAISGKSPVSKIVKRTICHLSNFLNVSSVFLLSQTYLIISQILATIP
eukprot:TRINITY_DN7788_c1_g5_i1.p2 TRINITY_DN7788_c1_g5~~TRINITY_DN7788_c1_g5_i1.p2  ORF type:complete len:183 (-),score=1.51 TRINITY_DN7788_c1_g5_i1:956-1504(-)